MKEQIDTNKEPSGTKKEPSGKRKTKSHKKSPVVQMGSSRTKKSPMVKERTKWYKKEPDDTEKEGNHPKILSVLQNMDHPLKRLHYDGSKLIFNR